MLLLVACNERSENNLSDLSDVPLTKSFTSSKSFSKTYNGGKFKDVTITKTERNEFRIDGRAQIEDPSFSWIIVHGNKTVKKGFAAPDEGAPAWGNFSFTISLSKHDVHSSLTLILFQPNSHDKSRKNELAIPLN
jgi:hypothetical protein